jgi:hypothetical protein
MFIDFLDQFAPHVIGKNFRHDGIEVNSRRFRNGFNNKVTTTVQGAEEMLGVEFHVFSHSVSGRQTIR